MKILVPSTERKDPEIDRDRPARIFGSATSYVIFDSDDLSYYSLENNFYDRNNEDVISELQKIAVDVIITERICMNCFSKLKNTNIDIYQDGKSITLKECLQKFMLGGLFIMQNSDNLRMHKTSKPNLGLIHKKLVYTDQHAKL